MRRNAKLILQLFQNNKFSIQFLSFILHQANKDVNLTLFVDKNIKIQS